MIPRYSIEIDYANQADKKEISKKVFMDSYNDDKGKWCYYNEHEKALRKAFKDGYKLGFIDRAVNVNYDFDNKHMQKQYKRWKEYK